MSSASGRSTSPMKRRVKCSCSSPTQRSSGVVHRVDQQVADGLGRADGDEQAVHGGFAFRQIERNGSNGPVSLESPFGHPRYICGVTGPSPVAKEMRWQNPIRPAHDDRP